MKALIAWWTRNPVAANLLMAGILIAGWLGFNNMEREVFPAVKVNQATVEVSWRGASAQDVEEQVIARIEEALEDLDSVYRVYATAYEGYANVRVATYPYVEIETFVNDVKNAVDSVTSFPRDIENPRVKRLEFREEMIRVALYGDHSERELTRLAEELRQELAALPYTSLVELFGARNEEVTIEISESALREYGLTFSEVANAIRSSSLNTSSGSVRTDVGTFSIKTRNLADTADDFGNVIIRQTPDFGTVLLKDVATIIDGFEENELLATVNGQPTVLLQVKATEEMQVVKASDAVTEWVDTRRKTLPEGLDLMIWFDTADIYKSRMETIGSSAYMGLILVFVILIATLRPRVALWVTGGIAVAFMGTFAFLPSADVSFNVISTFAFLLVLGIVVDDAIVVGESIHAHSEASGGGDNAAINGTYAVSKPVIFAVLTTILAFAPWFFVSGETAQITRQLSIVITLALTFSLIEVFLILPSHLRNLKPRDTTKWFAKYQTKIEHAIVSFANVQYRAVINAAIRHRYITLSFFVGLFIVSIGVFSSGWVKFNFMPQVENEQIYVSVDLPAGTPWERSLEVLEQLQDAERRLVKEVETQGAANGEEVQLIEGWYTRSRWDNVLAIIRLAPPETRALSAREAAERFQELVGDVPDAEAISVNYTLNDGNPRVTYMLRGNDLETLRSASLDIQSQLRTYQDAFFIRDSQRGEREEIRLNLKPTATAMGLTLAEVSRQVRQAYYGEEIQRLPREVGDVRVMVKYPKALRENLGSLDEFRIRTPMGNSVPLASVAEFEVGAGVQRIERRDGQRVIYVSADVTADAMSTIGKDMRENFIPALEPKYPTVKFGQGGSQEEEAEFLGEIQALYIVAMFMMYALIAVAFRSYWLPMLIMTAIPFGFMGAIYGHLLFGIPLALFSYFGIGAAAGVVVNDNLVLVDYIGRLREQGKSAVDAVIESGVNRFRPILLTTVTTFVGLMPIMAERATSAQFLKPAVLSLAFGVLFALFVTLLLVPALYMIGDDWRNRAKKVKQLAVETYTDN
ncbi:AcrB/AcrD/AcrF family protein [Aequoribacter fuscus]|uniref:AcrB/AcrD/AcrF family protein n=1 Tax=Aequoribacter fuscus TaxID=2518989 RepID=F3KZV5_9GAMM|nr:efflux RND transporter permease subunit [Aequoribacter fuscus]EGG30409.1 AcrB/AcrD/AcrF family protein [Aequoribacter fuscus]QHJ88518.1 efflux RND transporter permease subunit [Aequoribacter fuscus]